MERLSRLLAMPAVLVLGGLAAWTGTAPGAVVEPRADYAAATAQDTLGRTIFLGKGTCSACHGTEGKGTMLAPDLTDDAWLNIDGSVAQIARVVKDGVAQPKQHPAPMPPMGGAQLTDAEIQAVAAYVKSLSTR
jgi:mono/diheme cytochrome c family protein